MPLIDKVLFQLALSNGRGMVAVAGTPRVRLFIKAEKKKLILKPNLLPLLPGNAVR